MILGYEGGHQKSWRTLMLPLVWSAGDRWSDPLNVITRVTHSATYGSPITQSSPVTPGVPLSARSWHCQDFWCPPPYYQRNHWYAQMHDKTSLQPNHYHFEVRHGRLLKALLRAAPVSRGRGAGDPVSVFPSEILRGSFLKDRRSCHANKVCNQATCTILATRDRGSGTTPLPTKSPTETSNGQGTKFERGLLLAPYADCGHEYSTLHCQQNHRRNLDTQSL